MNEWTHEYLSFPESTETETPLELPGAEFRPRRTHKNAEPWDSYLKQLSNRYPGHPIQWGASWLGKLPSDQNDDQLMSPASVEKAITAATALRVLGPSFRFNNTFQGKLNPNSHSLHSVEFKDSRDPTWAHEAYQEKLSTRIDKVVSELVARGVKSVEGEIKITSTRPSLITHARPAEWKKEWLMDCGMTMFSSVIIRGNCAALKITSLNTAEWVTAGVDTPIEVEVTRTKSASKKTGLDVVPTFDEYGRVLRYKVVGRVSLRNNFSSRFSDSNTISVPVHLNEGWLRNLFKIALKKASIEYEAKETHLANALDQAVSVDISSIPLRDLIVPMMKESINLIADRLFVEIADHEKTADPSQAERDTLLQLSQNNRLMEGVKILDGSGLIAADQVSPKLLHAFLSGLKSQSYFQDFLKSLPIAGLSKHEGGGTLASTARPLLTNQLTAGKIFAKTGSLNDVINLAGYYLKADQTLEPFVVMTRAKISNNDMRSLVDTLMVKFACENAGLATCFSD